MMIKLILTILLILIIALFYINRFGKKDITDTKCPRVDPESCASYYCGDYKVECGIEDRFDQNTQQCTHYYFANCGNVYNPSLTNSATLLCDPDFENSTKPIRFPEVNCSLYAECFRIIGGDILFHLMSCPTNQHFDIYTRTCKPIDEVDCGSRNW